MCCEKGLHLTCGQGNFLVVDRTFDILMASYPCDTSPQWDLWVVLTVQHIFFFVKINPNISLLHSCQKKKIWVNQDSPEILLMILKLAHTHMHAHTNHDQDSDGNGIPHWHTSWTPAYSLIQDVFSDVRPVCKLFFGEANSLKQC